MSHRMCANCGSVVCNRVYQKNTCPDCNENDWANPTEHNDEWATIYGLQIDNVIKNARIEELESFYKELRATHYVNLDKIETFEKEISRLREDYQDVCAVRKSNKEFYLSVNKKLREQLDDANKVVDFYAYRAFELDFGQYDRQAPNGYLIGAVTVVDTEWCGKNRLGGKKAKEYRKKYPEEKL